jgi:hypothetical protein
MEPHPSVSNHAQCGSCHNWGKGNKRCYYLQAKDKVDADDSCGLYGQGKPQATVEPSGQYTKAELGFVDEQVRCENCREFDNRDPKHLHCDFYAQLTRILPLQFQLDKNVNPKGCCNAMMPGPRNPKNYGPYGPIPDADDPGAKGGLITKI